MLEEVLHYLHNYFIVKANEGTFTIQGGSIALDFLKNNQYFLIAGSIFNDGIHSYPADDLEDETFEGCIVSMAVPRDLLNVVDEMEKWNETNGNPTVNVSESYGGYSVTRATKANGTAASAIDVFADKLARWKKI